MNMQPVMMMMMMMMMMMIIITITIIIILHNNSAFAKYLRKNGNTMNQFISSL